MTRLFRRSWKVQVDTLDVSALDVEFKIVRSIKNTPGTASITLYNLNEDHRTQLLKRNKPGQSRGVPVKLEAGYVDHTSTLFDGDLGDVTGSREGLDRRITLHGDDGGRAFREGRINKTYKKGTQVATIAKDCAAAMGIGAGNIDDATGGARIDGLGLTISHAMTVSGQAAEQLTRILHSAQLHWSVQDGAVQVLGVGAPLTAAAIEISDETGLLDSPEATIDSTVSAGSPQQFAPGAKPKKETHKPKDPGIIKLKTLLIPGLKPGRKLSLKSENFNGGYYVTQVEYFGQSWTEQWGCLVVARQYT